MLRLRLTPMSRVMPSSRAVQKKRALPFCEAICTAQNQNRA